MLVNVEIPGLNMTVSTYSIDMLAISTVTHKIKSARKSMDIMMIYISFLLARSF